MAAASIGRKAEWPYWQPTANMIRTRPDLYAAYAGGLPGGLQNPLGPGRCISIAAGATRCSGSMARRIRPRSDHATSAGCIRLFNQDIIDLYNRVPNGTRVKVRSEAESLAIEARR